MFHHVKELQYNARVSGPDPRFATLLLEQFGGGNGELKAAMQYFVQAFSCRHAYPDKYDLLMDIATEEFSHLEIVGATITMLMGSVNAELKNAAESAHMEKAVEDSGIKKLVTGGKSAREELIQEALSNPEFLVLSGGGPTVTNAQGVPWSGSYVNANGDLTVDLRSNIAAESRAKIVYEYLMKFTNDPLVKESLGFLMTREIAHFQMFQSALATIQPNFPPGILQGDPHFTHVYFDMSNGTTVRGPWNQGQGPWMEGENWEFVSDPVNTVRKTAGLTDIPVTGTRISPEQADKMNRTLSKTRSEEVRSAIPEGENRWSDYPVTNIDPTRKVA